MMKAGAITPIVQAVQIQRFNRNQMFHRIGRKLGQAEVAPLNGLCNAFGQRSFVTRLAPWAGWLGIALVLAVLLSTVFGTMAQAYSLPAAEMQTATATPTPTPTPTGPTATVEEVLEKGLRLAEASPVHLAVRGTGVSSSTRCDWRGIARTLAQREAAIRFWLGLAATDTVPSASFLEILFTVTLDTLEPEYKETAKSNFLAIARGGLSTEYLFLTCYVDFTASEYLLGAGPTTVTLAYDRMGQPLSPSDSAPHMRLASRP